MRRLQAPQNFRNHIGGIPSIGTVKGGEANNGSSLNEVFILSRTEVAKQMSSSKSRPPSAPLILDSEDHSLPPTFIKDTFKNFIGHLGYVPPRQLSEPRKTYQALCSEFRAYDDGGSWFKKMCIEASTMAELSYPDHPMEVQYQIAKFTWFLIYVDDLGEKFPSALERFQQRVLAKEFPTGKFLQDFQEHLTDMYKFWDVVPANCINLAAMDFINGCLLEGMPVVRDMKMSPNVQSWPYFLRMKTGCASAYTFMLFPKNAFPDISAYIQVVEDITLFTNLTNDVLSFYKEYVAGETSNYVSNRAIATQKSLAQALKDTVDDALAAHDRVTSALESTDAYKPWKRFVNGYLANHFGVKRYRLGDLGF
ncbi:hypothetical protein CVT26_010937 [Gymnopilus dilepis]|uniref:Terpene synthase n=1 Tax=Gymnopilus dilepis TaxID=231916 RepID=A0A409VJ31_9AGAR|nr:hypothetical protein CVT26_010937 [Gymnopilus dilepis]